MTQFVYNCVPSKLDGTEPELPKTLKASLLPKSINLTPWCSPVVHQGTLNSCTANALVSGLREYLLIKSGQPLTRLSRLFVYYYERLMEGALDQDGGAEIKSGLIVLNKTGVCTEERDPYIASKLNEKPSKVEVTEAGKYKIQSYYKLKNLQEMKQCLAEHYPVPFGMDVFSHMESDECARTGVVKVPLKGDVSKGGHAVMAVGYEDNLAWRGGGFVLVRNSWGTEWGLNGYFKLSYAYMMKHTWDYWTSKG